MSEGNEEVAANAVLAFEDASGQRWLAAAFIGDLTMEKAPWDTGKAPTQAIEEAPRQEMKLVGFKVVLSEPTS
jgi:hypothetical protein